MKCGLHLVNIIIYDKYHKYREKRNSIKNNFVDSAQYETAKSELENSLTELNNIYPNIDNIKDFNYGEKIIMKHALNHLNAVINKDDPSFIDGNGQLKHQSDIVKESLLRQPKSDYS